MQGLAPLSGEHAVQWQELALELAPPRDPLNGPRSVTVLAVNSTRTFAHHLFSPRPGGALRPAHNLRRLAHHQSADAYAIAQMEHQLATFPQLVESIETVLAKSQPQPA